MRLPWFAAKAIASGASIDTKQILAELAGSEQVSDWSAAITSLSFANANWMQQQGNEAG